MKNRTYPIYCISSYPDSDKQFYMNRLETIVQDAPQYDEPHGHDFYMVLFIQKGGGTHTIDFVNYPITPQTLYFLTPGQVHYWHLEAGTEGYVFFFDSDFYLFRYPKRLYEYPFFHSNQYKPVLQLQEKQQFVCELIENMWEESHGDYPNREEVFLSYLNILLEKSSRFYKKDALKNVSNTNLAKIREFELSINEHFKTKKSVAEYADILCITANHLNALCKKTINKTASQLIQERIITEAKRLLIHSDMSIKEIAYHLSFDDTSYFSRYFKKSTQETPEGFRKQHSLE